MIRAAWVLVALLGVAHAALFHRYLTDDAFISFRYLDHWLAGAGLAYNPGERVWGFTNLGWILALAPLRALGAEPVWAARSLGLLATAGILLLVAGPLSPRPAAGRAGRLAAVLLLVANGGFLLQAWSGLETSAFSALALASLIVLDDALQSGSGRRIAAAAGLAAAATLMRPEGVLVFLALALGTSSGHASPGLAPGRAAAALSLGYLPPVLLAGGALASYYGAPWPNSIDAKVGASWEQLARGSHYLATYARYNPATPILVLLAVVRWRHLGTLERMLLFGCVGFGVGIAAAGGDWMFGYRLVHPLTVFSCALLPGLWRDLGGAARVLAALAVVGLAGVQLANSFLDAHVSLARRETYVHQGVRVGRWMRENLPPTALLATNTAGTLPYYSGLPVIDMMGLNDRTIARRRDLPPEWKGIEKGDGRYVLERRPDYIQFASSLGSSLPMFLSGIETYLEPSFHRDYELVSFRIDDETRVKLFRRRETPRAEAPSAADWARIRAVARRRMGQSRYRY